MPCIWICSRKCQCLYSSPPIPTQKKHTSNLCENSISALDLPLKMFCQLQSKFLITICWVSMDIFWNCTNSSKQICTLTNIWSKNPRVESKCFLRSHMRNSNTKYNFASSWRMCSKLTTFGWSFSSLRSEISRTAVLGIPSSANSSRIFFKATSLLFFLLRPLYTTP